MGYETMYRRDPLTQVDEVIGQRCGGPCGRRLALTQFSLDRSNKRTGRQRRCKDCFKSFWVRHRERVGHRPRPRVIHVRVAPGVWEDLAITAKVRRMSVTEFVTYIATMYAENALDMKLEEQLNSGEAVNVS